MRANLFVAAASVMTLHASGTTTAAPVASLMAPSCVEAGATASASGQARLPLKPEQLVALRDIGSSIDLAQEPAVTVSPAGDRAAFQIRWADVRANRYCLGMVVVRLQGAPEPRIVDLGGEAIRWSFPNLLGKADFQTGLARVISPRWSADGERIYFLKQDPTGVQVWTAAADGSNSQRMTHGVDVADFRIDARSGAIIYSQRTGSSAAQRAIAEEALSGFHFDDRYSPLSQSVPFSVAPLPMTYLALDGGGGLPRPASAAERLGLDEANVGGTTGDPRPASDARAFLDIADGSRFPPTRRIAAKADDGVVVHCLALVCQGIMEGVWWSPGTTSVLFLRREGWGREETTLYTWRPTSETPRKVFSSADVLASCQLSGKELLCLDEGSAQPRQLVGFDIGTGTRRIVFDPNPDWAGKQLGAVERIRWRGAEGTEVFGDVVYPVGYVAGRRYPLIVVQYSSRGFLRGGTGDEYPVQAFAARGFAVLSFQQPEAAYKARGARNSVDRDRNGLIGFRTRWANLEALEAGVRLLISRGVADRGRVGITGLSDGATTVQFAGLHSKSFKAAAMGSCCSDESQDAVLGPAISRTYHSIGWPAFGQNSAQFWRQLSWTPPAAKVAFPVLMQLADREYLAALPSYTAMRQRHDPVDLYVFPDEHHVKWQPAHRLAVYRRSLDWFAFWLMGVSPKSPEGISAAATWQQLAVDYSKKDAPIRSGAMGRRGSVRATSESPARAPSLGIK